MKTHINFGDYITDTTTCIRDDVVCEKIPIVETAKNELVAPGVVKSTVLSGNSIIYPKVLFFAFQN